MAKKSDDHFSPEEAKQRMEAALRGARIAGHKPYKPIAKKKKSPKKKTRIET
jgi:hypothetical protein